MRDAQPALLVLPPFQNLLYLLTLGDAPSAGCLGLAEMERILANVAKVVAFGALSVWGFKKLGAVGQAQ
ncbi:MAG: hypothetical protein IH971_08145 [Candidatus Marinimicrobia bacterium]|nr:hypothetical protein [Candidatus Neomarinimicrobiota bacterium]